MNIIFEIDKEKNVALIKEADEPLTLSDMDMIMTTALGIIAFNYNKHNISYEEFCNQTQKKINIFNRNIKELFNSEVCNVN